LPAVTATEEALSPSAPRLWAECRDNECFFFALGYKRAVESAFIRADHVSRLKLVFNRVTAATMEPRGCIGDSPTPRAPPCSAAVPRQSRPTRSWPKKIAAHELEGAEDDIEFADGLFRVVGSDRAVSLQEVAQAAYAPSRLPPEIETGLYEVASFS
jgi:CO/xanthine dehydrogenase Mo-binding subunit